jgi:lipid II:glycine glycyltransferase (peptidoglycan interpeptide bridge formation enzyme)
MRVLICKKNDEPVSTAIYTKIGERGIYILGATGNNGLKLNGSNLVHWEIIKRLKDAGCKYYDLGGVNPKTNPGVFRFKEGLSGKNGLIANHIGEHEYCSNPMAHSVLAVLENIRGHLKKRG